MLGRGVPPAGKNVRAGLQDIALLGVPVVVSPGPIIRRLYYAEHWPSGTIATEFGVSITTRSRA